MSALKKYLPLLLLLIIVYAWFFLEHLPQQPKKLNVLGASTNITLFVQPDTGRQPLLDAIANAQKEIDVEVYLLSDKQIIAALEDAHQRGVLVNVMMEQHPFGGGNLNIKTEKELDSHGVNTQWSSPSFALTHEKTMIIDNAEVFILSQNLTASSFSKNREYDIVDTSPQDVAEIKTIFKDDWEHSPFTPPTSSDIIESPDNSRGALTTLILSAQNSIDAETENIDDDSLINSFCDKAKKITVRILTPTLSQLSANQDELQKLSDCGVRVKNISSPYMHAKMIIEDSTKAYIGSINFSTQSMDRNREVGIILTESNTLQTLEATFEKDWAKAFVFSSN